MTHRCRHVEAIKTELRDAGATAIRTTRRRGTIWVSWILNGQARSLPIGAATRDEVGAAKMNRQRLRRLCPEIRAS